MTPPEHTLNDFWHDERKNVALRGLDWNNSFPDFVSVLDHGVPLVKRVSISFICVPLGFCVYQKVERKASATFQGVFEAEKCQCVDVFLSTLLRGGVEWV